MPHPPIKSAQTPRPPKDATADLRDDPTLVGGPQDAVEPPTLSEQMAAEAGGPREKPAGSPQFWPYKQLPRRMRAQFFDAIRSLDSLENLQQMAGTKKFGGLADYFKIAADAEDALRIIAHPSTLDKVDAWFDQADDMDVISLLVWYVDSSDLGEAMAS